MSKRVIYVVPGLLLSVLHPALLTAQAPPAAPAKPDSAEVKQHIEKAKKIAGTDWAGEANFFCLMPRANSPNDPLIEPTKIFDNVYAVGRSGTLVYAITTSDGIILIDSGYANDARKFLTAVNNLGKGAAIALDILREDKLGLMYIRRNGVLGEPKEPF